MKLLPLSFRSFPGKNWLFVLIPLLLAGCQQPDPLETVSTLSLPQEFSEATYAPLVSKKPHTEPEWIQKWGFDTETGGRFFTLGKFTLIPDCRNVLMAQETGGELKIWLLLLKPDYSVRNSIQLYYQDMVEYLFAQSSQVDAAGNIRIEETSTGFDEKGEMVPQKNVLELQLSQLCQE